MKKALKARSTIRREYVLTREMARRLDWADGAFLRGAAQALAWVLGGTGGRFKSARPRDFFGGSK